MEKSSFKSLLKRLRFFPFSYDKSLKKSLMKWLLLGLLIRLVLMPITAQNDLVTNYIFSHYIAKHNTYDIYSLRQISPSIALLYPPLAYYYMAAVLWVFDPLLPRNYCQVFDNALKVGVAASANGIPLESTYRLVWTYVMDNLGSGFYVFAFLVKLPSLIFDFGCAFILLRLIEDRKKAGTVFKFWVLNPVVIVVTYMQGQFDIVPAFLILLSIYFIKSQKLNKSFLSLGLSVAFKLFPVLLVPFNLLLSRNTHKKSSTKFKSLYLLAIAIGPLLISVLPFFGNYLLNIHSWQFSTTTPGALSFKLNDLDLIFPYAMVYTFLLLFAWQNSRFSHISVAKYSLSALLAYYALSFFHPQYFVWATPLILLLMAYMPNFKKYYIIQLLTFFIYTFNWGRYYALNFFTPVYQGFFDWLSPKEIIAYYVDPTLVTGVVRSAFSAVSLWMIWEMIKTERKTTNASVSEKTPDESINSNKDQS